MELNELYLKTAFCCMACDGEIAEEEIELIKNYVTDTDIFGSVDVEKTLNEYIANINQNGMAFLKSYLKDLKTTEKTEEDELLIVNIAIQMIEADNEILYSELKFFKRLRACLDITDDAILKKYPDKEDYLLPDIMQEEYEFLFETSFSEIKFDAA